MCTYLYACVNTCSHAYTHVHMHKFTHKCVHTCKQAYIHISMRMYMHIHMHWYMYTCAHTNTNAHIYMYVHMRTYTYTCVHTHIHAYVHMRMRTYTYTCGNTTRGRSAQDPPCPRAHVRSKKKNPEFDSRFRQNFTWEASPEALLEVISDENIGRTDKLSKSC